MMLRRGAALLTALSLALMPVALAAVLEVGSRGDDVAAVQRKLIQWGYLNGVADGRYGEKTRAAVEELALNAYKLLHQRLIFLKHLIVALRNRTRDDQWGTCIIN